MKKLKIRKSHYKDYVAVDVVENNKIFQHYDYEKNVVFIASAKLGLPAYAIKAFALGADMINMAREILIAGGCLQTQKCHTGDCPTLIATSKHQHLYNIEDKKQRVANFICTLRKDILEITHACGYEHPCQIKTSDIDMNTVNSKLPISLEEVYGYEKTEVSFKTMNDLETSLKNTQPEKTLEQIKI